MNVNNNEAFSIWNANSNLFRFLLFSTLILVGLWIISSVLHRKIFPLIIKRINPQSKRIIYILLEGFRTPINLFIKISAICIALLIMCNWFPIAMSSTHTALATHLPDVLYKTLRITGIICFTWGLISSSNITSLILHKANSHLDLQLGKSVSQFLSAIYKLVVIIIAFAILLKEFGYDISGLITGLGLGGLTIALAAKDSAANFFGGLILITEKPFEIGDWIVCDGAEGTVEDINIRSTSIRTFQGALTVVPNANLSGDAITNYGGCMTHRRADITLQLSHNTPSNNIKAYCEAVRALLEADPEIESKDILVRFSKINEIGLEITIQFFSTYAAIPDHLRVKERVNFLFLALAQEHEISFAEINLPIQQKEPPKK